MKSSTRYTFLLLGASLLGDGCRNGPDPRDLGPGDGLVGAEDAGSGIDLAGDLAMLAAVISGNVFQNVNGVGAPLAGATVEVVGAMPAISTTTAKDGSFSLLSTAGPQFIRVSDGGHYPDQFAVVAPVTRVVMAPPPANFPQQVEQALGTKPDPAKGIVAAHFEGANMAGGYGANLGSAHGITFAFTPAGSPMISSTTIAGGSDTLVFLNTAPGMTTVTPTPPQGKTCMPQPGISIWRADPGVLTELAFACQ